MANPADTEAVGGGIAGPWEIVVDSEGFDNIHHPREDGHLGDIVATCFQDEAHTRLLAAAPDHALIGWAMCVAAGRWEPANNGVGGEFCIHGIRHSTKLDEFGCPILTANLRGVLLKARAS